MRRLSCVVAVLLVGGAAACASFGSATGDVTTPPDAASDAGAPPDTGDARDAAQEAAGAPVVFADDFEHAPLCAGWKMTHGTAMINVTTGDAHGGTSFCHVCVTSLDTSSNKATFERDADDPQPGPGTFKATLWIRHVTSPPADFGIQLKTQVDTFADTGMQPAPSTWSEAEVMGTTTATADAGKTIAVALNFAQHDCFDVDDVSLVYAP